MDTVLDMAPNKDRTGLLLLALALGLTCISSYALPQRETTTIRSKPPVMQETFEQLQDQLLDANMSSSMNFDTRTPPRVKQQQLTKLQEAAQKAAEKSHPGIAVPIDDEALSLEMHEDPKKLTFYKSDKPPTTDSGISTWILLSGQNNPTTTIKSKITPKPVTINKEDDDKQKNNSAVNEKPIKPIFRRRPMVTTTTTTKKPTTIYEAKELTAKNTVGSKKTSATIATPTTTKIMKKASVVINSVPTSKNATKKITTSTSKPKLAPEKKKPAEPTEFVQVPMKVPENATAINGTSNTESNVIINPEGKDGGIELSTQSASKKTRRPTTNKKKKNKRRKTKPSADDKIVDTVVATTNSTTKLSTKMKNKPFSTQIYNYISREVMPTVGVGLVGLMVTAGLASYFLYPFGALRRSYDIDRKDKEGSIYYKDPYSLGGMAEEEMIGKVIAGMPAFGIQTSKNQQKVNVDSAINYNRIQGSRNSYPTTNVYNQQQRYRQVETKAQGTVENVQLPYANANYQGTEMTYLQNTPAATQEAVPTYTEKQFVVGNIPKELEEAVTPVVVPEHGPRRRKRRQVEYLDNEVDSHITKDHTSTTANVAVLSPNSTFENENFDLKENGTSSEGYDATSSSTEESIYAVADKVQSILDLVKDLIFYKLKIGLEILQNKTVSMSRYISRIQGRIDKTYRQG